jgi:hypothetical protein
VGVIAHDRLAGGRIFGRVVVELGEPDADRLEVVCEAASALVVDTAAELALGVKALGCAGEGDPAAQVVHGEVLSNFDQWLVKLKVTSVANAFFKKEPDV